MKIKTILERLTAAATASAMIVTGFAIAPVSDGEIIEANAASAVIIDTTTEYQTIRGFGGINHPEWTGADMTDSQRKTAFNNGANDLGLTILRVFVNPDKNQWNKAVPTAKYASSQGAYVFASPWEPPSELAESGGSNGKLHLPKSNYGAYAQHLNDFGTYMKNNGVDLYSISVQNEPDYASEWTYWSTDETVDFIANYGDQITSTRLMSPESFQYAPLNASWVADGGKKFYKKIMENSKAFANCDVFGTHMYGTTRDWMDYPELENCGKEIWMTEVYVPNSEADSANRWPEALQVSENIHNALVVGNMSAYTWWYIRRSYGLMDESGVITKRGYNMAQFSKWVRPGDKRIEATEQPADDVLVSAYKNDNNQVTVVAINKSSTGYAQAFNIGSGEKIVDVDRYRTSESENIALTENLENDGSGFFAQLPANSVSTFVISLEGSGTTPTVQPDENGYYYHDEFEGDIGTWESRGASEVKLSGRIAQQGKESLLITERTASWNGAAKSLDAKIFKPGEEYSFSTCAAYYDGGDSMKFFMKLQYTGSDGETHYSTIAEGETVPGTWVQLANTNYKIPSDASNMTIYVETESVSDNFYIDEAIGAAAGTKISGPPVPVITTTATTTTTTTTMTTTKAATTTTTTETAPSKPVANLIAGDIDCDGRVDVYDLVLMREFVANGIDRESYRYDIADVNADGEVSAADLVLLQQFLLGQKVELRIKAG